MADGANRINPFCHDAKGAKTACTEMPTIGAVNQFPANEPNPPDIRDRYLLRMFLAACQATSLLLTWPLWQVRSEAAGPPNLPVLDLAILDRLQVPLGETLLLTLVVAVVWPRIGVWAHAVVLAAAICLDQLRIQPEFVSLAILLIGTLPNRGPLVLARCHLISLWFWAGLHKLLSPGYLLIIGPDLVHGLFPSTTTSQAIVLGGCMAVSELDLGLAAVYPFTRRAVPTLAAVLHGAILLTLVARGWNTAVWPWNLALAVAGVAMFRDWHEPLWAWDATTTDSPPPLADTRARWLWKSAAVVMLAYPALFYFNLCDGYLAWCVYSNNVPEAIIVDAASSDGQRVFDRAYASLNVPFSPAIRLYEQYFRRVGRLDDRMTIDDPRPLSRWSGRGQRGLIFTTEGPRECQPAARSTATPRDTAVPP